MYEPKNRVKNDANNFESYEDGISPNVWNRERYTRALRVLLSDIPELNPLLGTIENSDDKLALILDLTLSDFNHEPPHTTFSYENFPNPNCLLQGAMAMTLDSSSIMHARNSLQYTDNGIGFEDFGKDTRYAPLAAKFQQNYMRLVDTVKRTWNANQCFGSISSEYRLINGRPR